VLILALALVVGLALSAFFTASEAALFSLGESRVRTLVEEQFRGSKALARLRERPERLIVLLRLGDVLADMCAAIAATAIAIQSVHGLGLALTLVVVALVVLLVGELMPLAFAVTHTVRIALFVAPILLVLQRALGPVLSIIEKISHLFPDPVAAGAASATESEIRQLTALGHTEGVIEEHERQLIERAFRLDELKAWDIMTPRVDVFAWPDSKTLAEIAPELGTVPYSRVPVYGESIDDITGVLYVRDAYQALVSGQRDVPLRALAREPLIVPGSLSLTRLLRDFQTRRIHLAIVVDEYGGTDGLVTLEDLLEELVGDIVDETDVAHEPIVRVSRQEIVAAGDADLREINHYFNTSFPQLEHRSLNGYLLDELGRVPETGETIERGGIIIEVLEATDTQVIRARLRRATGTQEAAGQRPSGEQSIVSEDILSPDRDSAPGDARTSRLPAKPARAENAPLANIVSKD
jgi:putative hemolysin